jgi:hypothetical protein
MQLFCIFGLVLRNKSIFLLQKIKKNDTNIFYIIVASVYFSLYIVVEATYVYLRLHVFIGDTLLCLWLCVI